MNSAELLDRIEEAAIRGDVVEALLLCQKLGGDAQSAELREWARRELEGYPEGEPPPDYRRVVGQLFASGAAPGMRLSAVPIPMDALPEPERSTYEQGIPLLHSITVIQQRASEERVAVRTTNTTRLLRAINTANDAPTMFDDVYVRITGPTFAGVVTTVRSRVMSLVSELRAALPADEQLAPAVVQAAVSEVIGPVVTVTGGHNVFNVGDSGDIKVSTGSDSQPEDEPTRTLWRWLKRILEAITVFGAAVSFVGGGSFNPF